MAEIRCKSCNAPVPLPSAAVGSRLVVECAFCGSRFGAAMPEPTGFETISYPQAWTERGREPADSPADLDENSPAQRLPTGTALLIPRQSLQKAARPAPPQTLRRANLVVEGPRGAHLPLTGTRIEVGRKGAHIVIADPALSANHFVIEANGESFIIRDLGSSNGTRLNGHTIRSAKLKSGDTIDAGKTTFSFRIEEVIPWDRSG